jgi:phage shock protein PspC (stress-responsive transcriptional regulator)
MKLKGIEKRLSKHRTIIAIALIAVIILAMVPTGLNTYVPGPEGPNVIAYGVSLREQGDKVYFSGTDKLPSTDSQNSWKFVNNQPSVMSVKHIKYGSGELISTRYREDNGIVTTELQDAYLDRTDIRTVEFSKFVQKSDTEVEVRKVTCSIATATFKIGIYSSPGNGYFTFKDLQLWYNLDTVKWMNAFQNDGESFAPSVNATTELQDIIYRGAYPLNAIIDDYKIVGWHEDTSDTLKQNIDSGAQAKTVLSPSIEGRPIDLYSEPSLNWEKVTNYQAITDQSILSLGMQADGLPDGRFSEDVYFYINLDSFGAFVKDGGLFNKDTAYYPSVEYTIKVQYAIYGEFVYLWTKEAAEEVGMDPDKWESRNSTVIYYKSPLAGLFDGIGEWFGGNSSAIYMIMVIVILVLIVYLAGPLIRNIGKGMKGKGGA